MGLFKWSCIGCKKTITLNEFEGGLDDFRIDPPICNECFDHPLGQKLLEEREKRIKIHVEFAQMRRFWVQTIRSQHFDEMLEQIGYEKNHSGENFNLVADLVSHDAATYRVVFETLLFLQGRVDQQALKYVCQKYFEMANWELPDYLIGDFGCCKCLGRYERDCECR